MPASSWNPWIVTVLLTACSGVSGNGPSTTEDRSPSTFTAVEAGGAVEVEIDVGDDNSIQVIGDDDITRNIRTDVSDGTLVISNDNWLGKTGKVLIKVTTPQLASVTAQGATTFDIDGVKAEDLQLSVSGASRIQIEGSAQRLRASLSGASKLSAEALTVQSAEIRASGASHAAITVEKALEVHASGASHVSYRGNPAQVDRHATGASSINPD